METNANSLLHAHYLSALGIQAWQLRSPANPVTPACSKLSSDSADWEILRQAVASCTACGLEKTRTQTVFGVGNRAAEVMVIGEAPGFNEDRQGEPFVGRAGQLLTLMLEAIGFTRESVYICNILKCRPPNNRDPQPEEVSLCTPFLGRQIALVKPKLLLAVGRIASHYLLNTKTSLAQLRGKIHRYDDTPLIITYHPAYLLRNPADKKKAYDDLKLAFRTLETLS
jgi:uracil-DNA glycosylase family 4